MKKLNARVLILLISFGWLAFIMAVAIFWWAVYLYDIQFSENTIVEGVGFCMALLLFQLLVNFAAYKKKRVRIGYEPVISLALWGLAFLSFYSQFVVMKSYMFFPDEYDNIPRAIAKGHFYAAIMYLILEALLKSMAKERSGGDN